MKLISIFLVRTPRRSKSGQCIYEAPQKFGPVDYLFLSGDADRALGQPKALRLTLEPAPALDREILNTLDEFRVGGGNAGHKTNN
jgi:hypothetical protein